MNCPLHVFEDLPIELSMPPESYLNPPIQEAIVEFRYRSGRSWSPVVPGQLYDALSDRYPSEPKQQPVVSASVAVPEGGQGPSRFAVDSSVMRTQFLSSDRLRLASVGPNVLSVHSLRPYEGWKAMRPRVLHAFEVYRRVLTPEAVIRIGVRYINRVVVPQPEVELADYFACAPKPVEGLPPGEATFLHRTEHVYDSCTRLVLTFGNASAPPGASAYLLDLDVVWEAADAIALGEVEPLVDSLRDRERAAFEALITPSLRALFDA